MNLIGKNTSDPYVRVSFGVHKRVRHKSCVVYRTLNPRWAFSKKFRVVYPESTLKISVWDYDQLDAHDFLGHVELPVALFRNQKEHDAWYALKPYDGVKRGRIRVKVTFNFSKYGELFSHLIEKDTLVEETPTLNINHLYAYAMDLLDEIEPFKAFPSRVVAVLNWERPGWTVFWLIMFWNLTHHPHYTMPFGHLCLLFYIFKKYMQRRFGRATNSDHAPMYIRNLFPNARDTSKPTVAVGDTEPAKKQRGGAATKASDEEEELSRMDHDVDERDRKLQEQEMEDDPANSISLGTTGDMIDMVLRATPGATESLAGLQAACKGGVSGVKALYSLFDWSDFQKTKGVTYGVFGSMLVFTFVPNNYIFLVVGLLAFFNGTPPFQVFKRYAMGLVAWLTTATPSPADLGIKSVSLKQKRFKAAAMTARLIASLRSKAK
eukprot:g4088.t1